MAVEVKHKDVYRPIEQVSLTGGVGHTIVEKSGTRLLFRHGYWSTISTKGNAVFEQQCDSLVTKADALAYAKALIEFAKEL